MWLKSMIRRLSEKRVRLISGGRILYRDGENEVTLDYERFGGQDSYLLIPLSLNQRWDKPVSREFSDEEMAKAKQTIECVMLNNYQTRVEVSFPAKMSNNR